MQLNNVLRIELPEHILAQKTKANRVTFRRQSLYLIDLRKHCEQ